MRDILDNKKIILNTPQDLYNLSYASIRNTKLTQFGGKYFDLIREEAEKIERSNIQIEDIPLVMTGGIVIDFLEFEIGYQTAFGQNIRILGNLDEMGSWDFKKGLELTWHPNNIWKAKIKYYDYCEIKYVLKEANSELKWENGTNRKINTIEIKEELQKLNTSVKMVKRDQMVFTYDSNERVLNIKCIWK